MRWNLFFGPAMAMAACLLVAPPALAQVGDCPQNACVESETSIVFNPQTNAMDAFTTATTDYTTSYWYDLCVDLAVGRLNGPLMVNATNLLPSGTPWCSPGAVQVSRVGSVAATPGRQYYAVGLAQLHVFFEYYIFVPYPACGPYCEGYWYDALGYSQPIATQPSNSDWPSIVYTYPIVLLPVPVLYVEIAMSGSADTAWAPPMIYSVTPNQWPAGATTTFTISGAGFGYSPDLTINGTGIVGYTNPCASPNSSPSCDTQIVATVTIDANAPGGLPETITVTANGLNPSGFQPVPIAGQSGQATSQAVVLALIAFRPYIVLGTGGGACAGVDISLAPRSVLVGQQINFTGCLPPGTSVSNVSSMTWTPTTPPGTAVGGFTAINSGASSSGTVVPLSSPTCATGQFYCSFPPFYWVDQGNNRQFTFRYTLTNGSANEATATFNVGGPTGVNVTATPSPAGVTIVYPPANFGGVPIEVPIMIFGAPGVRGMNFYATATNLASGSYRWIQLVQHDRITILGSQGKTGPTDQIPGQPAVDKAYPYGYDQQGNPTGSHYDYHPQRYRPRQPGFKLDFNLGRRGTLVPSHNVSDVGSSHRS